MESRSRLRAFAFALLALGCLPALRADTAPASHAVIRGTGSHVEIVYQAPRAPKAGRPQIEPADPASEALRLKTAGADDETVIGYLRIKQAELPDVIDADVVKDLRRAGAQESLISVLSSFAAVDIGETGEGGIVYAPQASGPMALEGAGYADPNAGYPFYGGGYGGFGALGSGRGRLGFGPRVPVHHVALFRFGKPVQPIHPHPMPLPMGGHGGMGHRLR
jgi:hypothetical protein